MTSWRKRGPSPRSDAAPAAKFVAQTGEPCPDQSLSQSKSDQTLAGLLARGSRLDARPSQSGRDDQKPVAVWADRGTDICILLAAYSCRDSCGLGCRYIRTAFPFKPRRAPARSIFRQTSCPLAATHKGRCAHCQAFWDERRRAASAERVGCAIGGARSWAGGWAEGWAEGLGERWI